MASSVFAVYPSLRERSVLVTGGATGIGASIVEHFCSQGARVSFIDELEDTANQLVSRVANSGALGPTFIRADVRNIDALREAVVLAADAVGTISVLVNNVARDDRHSLEDVTAAYWDEMMAVNLRHQFFAAQAVRAGMASLGGGSIVNLGSTSWIRAEGGMPVYTTAKAAVWGLTRSLARDLGPFNVRVNAVAPGWVMTERQRERWLTPESEQRLLEDQCLREKLQPSDVARLVLWLAADDSRLIPGQQFIVDPGRV